MKQNEYPYITLKGNTLRALFDSGVLVSLHDPKAENFGKKGWRFRWRTDLLHAYVVEFKNEDVRLMFMLKYGA